MIAYTKKELDLGTKIQAQGLTVLAVVFTGNCNGAIEFPIGTDIGLIQSLKLGRSSFRIMRVTECMTRTGTKVINAEFKTGL